MGANDLKEPADRSLLLGPSDHLIDQPLLEGLLRRKRGLPARIANASAWLRQHQIGSRAQRSQRAQTRITDQRDQRHALFCQCAASDHARREQNVAPGPLLHPRSGARHADEQRFSRASSQRERLEQLSRLGEPERAIDELGLDRGKNQSVCIQGGRADDERFATARGPARIFDIITIATWMVALAARRFPKRQGIDHVEVEPGACLLALPLAKLEALRLEKLLDPRGDGQPQVVPTARARFICPCKLAGAEHLATAITTCPLALFVFATFPKRHTRRTIAKKPTKWQPRERMGNCTRDSKRTDRRDRIILALVFVLGSAVYWTTADHHGRRGGVAELDGYYYYVYLRSIAHSGDIDFHDEYERWGNPFGYGDTPTGLARNVFGVGPAVAWSPFYLVAHTTAKLASSLGHPISTDGLSRYHQRITFYGSFIYGWLALLFCYLACREIVEHRWAMLASLGAALAGPLPYYCLTGASYSHAPATMATSLLVWLWLRYRKAWTTKRWMALGAAAGLAVLIRPATAPVLLIPLYEGMRQLWSALRARDPDRLAPKRPLPRSGFAHQAIGPLAGAAVALLVFFPQLWVWKLMYGSWLTIPQGEGFMWWTAPAWSATLFAPRNGFYPSAPLMVFASLGLLYALWQKHGWAIVLTVTFAAIVLLNGVVHDWWGWNYSARRFTHTLPIMALGLGVFVAWLAARIVKNPLKTASALVVAFVLAFSVFNLEWMHQYRQNNLKWYSVRSTEGLYMTVAHGLLKRVYDSTGNPFGLPAALAFTWQQDSSPKTYDRIEGSYLLGETNPRTLPSAKPYLHALIPLYQSRLRSFLSSSFGSASRDEFGVGYVPLRARAGHIFLPINRPGKLEIWIRARGLFAGTQVELRLAKQLIGSFRLHAKGWQTLYARIPAEIVQRGINRLDLWHTPPSRWSASGARTIGQTKQKSPIDIAVASGGLDIGRFCDIWIGRRRHGCSRGINLVVLDKKSGALLGRRAVDAHIHPAAYGELSRYLDHFPAGSIVALGTRDNVGRHFSRGGSRLLARIGAKSDLSKGPRDGYAAIGVLGAKLGSAIEEMQGKRHARARVGRKPPTWRELARYSAIRLR
jgi:hypothetical protein